MIYHGLVSSQPCETTVEAATMTTSRANMFIKQLKSVHFDSALLYGTQ